MKLPIVFLAVLGLACGKSLPTPRNLQDDLNDFIALVPLDEVVAIALDYLANDAEVQEAVAYVQGDEFHTLVKNVESLTEFGNFVIFLEDHGLDFMTYIDALHDFLGMEHYPHPKQARRGVGVTGLIDDIIAILPVEELHAMFLDKLENSPDFKAFYDAVRGEEFQSIISALNAMPEYQNLLQKLKDYGVDVDHYIDLIRALFGLTESKVKATKNLQDDLNDFIALVPLDEVVAIALDYLANDAEVQEAVAYVQGDEFHTLVKNVESLTEFGNFVIFLEDHGLDFMTYIDALHDFLGMEHYPHPKQARRGVGVTGLIDDIIAILPVEELHALFLDKLETSPDFKAFYDAIRGEEFQSIISALNAMPEYQNLLQKLKDYGVDVDHYIDLIRALFGLTESKAKRNLQDDLNDFIALVPLDEVVAIALDYLANDAEVQEAVAYVQGDEFHTLVKNVESLTEFGNFVIFLEDHGLDFMTYIDALHDFLGMEHYPHPKQARRGVGVTGLIDDIIAILPVEELHALFLDKLENSPDFKAFYDAVRGEEFQSIISALNAMPEYQNLLQKLKDYGVDVDHYIDLIRALFGLTESKVKATKNLQDDLNDFIALVPLDEVVAIALDYLANDAEVQEAVAYVQGDEFHTLVKNVESLTEFGNFVIFLEDHGLDFMTYIDALHDFLGMEHYPHPKQARRGVGVTGLIDDIIAILPVEELHALFLDKLETSPDFKAFYDAIRGEEFQSIISALNAMPEYQNLLQKLKDYGVDVDHYIDLIRALFGLTESKVKATKNLQDDLNDFLALIPVDQILTIALDYLANDSQVQELVAYLQSDAFHTIITTVEALQEFHNFIDFLSEHGLDVVEYLNEIHAILGLPPFSPQKSTRRGVGINGLIDDVIAILPVEELKALFQEKLETSPDFKALYDAIRSPEFQSIIETLNSLPEYQELLQALKDYGVDVDHWIELIRALFGL